MANLGSLVWVSQLQVTLSGTVRGRVESFGAGSVDQYRPTVGTGIGAVNTEWEDNSGTIAAGGTVNIDLAGGIVDDITGATISLAAVKFIKLINASLVAGTTIRMGGGTNPFIGPWGATGFTDVVSGGVGFPGEYCNWNPSAGGWVVTAGTGDILKLVNQDGVNAAAYRLYLAGF